MSRWHRSAWLTLLLAAVLMVSACSPSDAAPVSTNDIVSVDKGSVRVSVSATGNVTLPRQSSLNFGSAGTVKKVAVAAGDRVTAGQLLAELDDVDLAAAVANAELNVVVAKDNLANLDPTPVDLAKAIQAAAAAQLQTQTAQIDLDKVKAPYSDLDLKKQQQSVASAKAQLQTAKTALDTAQSPTVYTQQDLKNQAAAIATARVQVQNAKNALTKSQSAPYSDQAVKQQQEAVAAAQQQLQAAQDNLTKLTTPAYTTEELVSAQAAIDRAIETVKNNQNALAVTTNQQANLVQTALDNLNVRKTNYRQAMLAKYQIPVLRIPEAEILLDPLTLSARYYFGEPTNAADPTGSWNAVVVAQNSWDAAVNQQNIALTAARRAITQSEDALRTAQTTLTNLQQAGPKDTEVALARAKIATAQANITAAQDQLKAMLVDPDPLDVALKQAQVVAAEATLAAAQQKLSDMQAPPDPTDLALKQAAVATAQAAVADAAQKLAEMVPDPQVIAAKQASLDAAKTTLADAQQKLADLKSGGDPVVRAQRVAAVKNAEQSLSNAKDKVEKAHIKAPFAGAVSTVSVKEGDSVNANTAAFVVVDPTQVEVNAIVDEVDVLRVRAGQDVLIGLQSAQGLEIPGKVKVVSLLANRSQGIVSYPIIVSVTLPTRGGDGERAGGGAGQGQGQGQGNPGRIIGSTGAAGARGTGGTTGQAAGRGALTGAGAGLIGGGDLLRDGLSALLTIVISEQPDAVRVPVRAISTSGRNRVVKVVRADGTIEDRTVEIGLSDGAYTQIVSGLEEGEKVQVPVRATSASRTGNAPGVGGPGGGALGGLGGRQIVGPGGR